MLFFYIFLLFAFVRITDALLLYLAFTLKFCVCISGRIVAGKQSIGAKHAASCNLSVGTAQPTLSPASQFNHLLCAIFKKQNRLRRFICLDPADPFPSGYDQIAAPAIPFILEHHAFSHNMPPISVYRNSMPD